MKVKMFYCILILAIVQLTSITSLQAQNAWVSTADSVPFKKISGIPYEHYPELLDWIITSEETSIAFINDLMMRGMIVISGPPSLMAKAISSNTRLADIPKRLTIKMPARFGSPTKRIRIAASDCYFFP